MKTLQELFRLKKPEESQNDFSEDKDDDDREQIRITYYQSGYGASIKAMGKPIVFRACLQNLFSSFKDQCKRQETEQEQLKQPYREEQERSRTELKKCETNIEIHETKEQELNHKLEHLKKDIFEVKQNPEKFGIEDGKNLKVQFYIGLTILFPISLYLFVFYVSACYSAFFKEFSENSLSAAIFDADALNNAIKASWLEAVLVITIPFVFMGLGYIVHMLQKGKGREKWIKIGVLYLVTFLFDGILAYQIEKKIYEFNKTTDSAPYNLRIALAEADFWMIIFAGFVVYIIWGLVFDIMIKEYENTDKIKAFIKVKKEEIANLNTLKTTNTEKLNEYRQQLNEINGKIAELQSKINGFILPIKEYLYYHYQFKEGWYKAIAAEIALPHKEKTQLLENCDRASEELLYELELGYIDVNADLEAVTDDKI